MELVPYFKWNWTGLPCDHVIISLQYWLSLLTTISVDEWFGRFEKNGICRECAKLTIEIKIVCHLGQGNGNPLQYSFFFFYCSEFCHTLKWNSHGFTCVPHHDPPSHLPLHLLPLVFLPGEFHGQRNLPGYNPWGCKRVWHDWITNTFNPTQWQLKLANSIWLCVNVTRYQN